MIQKKHAPGKPFCDFPHVVSQPWHEMHESWVATLHNLGWHEWTTRLAWHNMVHDIDWHHTSWHNMSQQGKIHVMHATWTICQAFFCHTSSTAIKATCAKPWSNLRRQWWCTRPPPVNSLKLRSPHVPWLFMCQQCLHVVSINVAIIFFSRFCLLWLCLLTSWFCLLRF